MARPYRLLWLPVLAAVLPCAFIGVIGYSWLALEREAAGHRSATAARAAADALARDLAAELERAGAGAARALEDWPAARPAFQPPPELPPILAAAHRCDSSRRLFAPDDEAAGEAAVVPTGWRPPGLPGQQRAGTSRHSEQQGRTNEAIAAATWLSRSGPPAERAPVLLALSRRGSGWKRALPRSTRRRLPAARRLRRVRHASPLRGLAARAIRRAGACS
jgi:hypothetical protein